MINSGYIVCTLLFVYLAVYLTLIGPQGEQCAVGGGPERGDWPGVTGGVF